MSSESNDTQILVFGFLTVIGFAFSIGFLLGGETTEVEVSNDTVKFNDANIEHFCIEQGYDRGYYSNYFNDIKCATDYNTKKFKEWEQKSSKLKQ